MKQHCQILPQSRSLCRSTVTCELASQSTSSDQSSRLAHSHIIARQYQRAGTSIGGAGLLRRKPKVQTITWP